MADSVHLDKLIAQQKDAAEKRLLTSFAAMARNSAIKAEDYPARMRQVMDAMFEEASRAPAKPDGA
ncbi:hypothetical protein [Nitrosospira sp. NRS527]|uniref:hypothetical protein n=1 Tax=Nitrosospira sp. NRS527 TaxID=155925 RepID=UPI001AF64331|nr:hypothetical protein [Nitrosospira sp. NRS527]BCT69570.1 hypothetical protein NNRS527_03195 [Nitrosospira sp. NRS527]